MSNDVESKILFFLKELLHPEGFGYAVTQEVRDHAKQLVTLMEKEKSNEQN